MFKKYEIISITIGRNPLTYESQGFGYIRFKYKDDLIKIVNQTYYCNNNQLFLSIENNLLLNILI